MILLYNFTPERMRLVRRAAEPLGCTVRGIPQKDFTLSVGFLTGLTQQSDRKPTAESFNQEMLVISGLSGEGIDIFLAALKKCGAGYIPIKAVVTETNASWSGYELYHEIKKEHEAMSSSDKR